VTSSPLTSPARGSSAAFQRAVFAGFVGNGVFTVILGPTLPALSAKWLLNDSQAGFFFTAQFCGSVLGVILYGLLARRYGPRFALIGGYALMGFGVALLGAPALRLAQLGIFTAGFGYGLVTPASNLAVATGDPKKRAARLNLLNFTWGIGAVLCPFLVAFGERRHHLDFFLWGLTAALVAFALSFVMVEIPRAESTPAASGPHARASLSPRLVTALALFVPLFFLYVGTETSFSGWAGAMALEMAGFRGGVAALMPSFFWATLLLGRASAPAALRFLSEKTLALSGLTLAFVASLLWIIAHDTAVLALALVLAGAGCSTIFPILVAWLTQFTDESASGWRSLAFGAASFGGAVLPKLVGTLSTHFGGLRAGFSLVALAISAMIVLVLFLHRGEAGTAPTAEV